MSLTYTQLKSRLKDTLLPAALDALEARLMDVDNVTPSDIKLAFDLSQKYKVEFDDIPGGVADPAARSPLVDLENFRRVVNNEKAKAR